MNKLNDVFDIEEDEDIEDYETENAIVTVEENTSLEVIDGQSELDSDFELVRKNQRDLVGIVGKAVEELAFISRQSEQPRSYDALSKIASAATAANKALLEIYKNKREGKDYDDEQSGKVVHNTIVMTTADMLRQIEDAQKKQNGTEEETED